MQPTTPLLQVAGVSLEYVAGARVVRATHRVSFDLHAGERLVLLGPSGCGKSSLLKAIGGFLAPVEGRITLGGAPVTAPGPDRLMVFQEFDQLLPWQSVTENVMFPLLCSGKIRNRKEARDRALHYLEKVNLSKFVDSHPHMLSGGMKQRVAIARGMAMEPDVLLMDDPFAALDALTRVKMQDELLELWDDTHFTVLFVTHSINEAIKIGNRIMLMSPHPGQVKAELNGLARDEIVGPKAKELERYIHQELFADKIEEGVNHG